MSLADELDKLHRTGAILFPHERDTIRRAVEALRAAELLVENVPPCDENRDVRWRAAHARRNCDVSEAIEALFALLYQRPSAAGEKP